MTQVWPAKFFSLAELVQSDTATRLSIDNTPPPKIIARLADVAERMDRVRGTLHGNPIHVSSGYRCKALNTVVNGAPNSAHMDGYAVDFTCPDFGTPLAIAQALRVSGIRFDQVITEGTWVHISFAPAMRQQCLTARFKDGGPPTYEEGLKA